MNHPLLTALGGALLGPLAIAPVPEFTFVLQGAGVGAFVGTCVLLYREHRAGSDSDRRAQIIASLTAGGGTLAALWVLGTGVL